MFIIHKNREHLTTSQTDGHMLSIRRIFTQGHRECLGDKRVLSLYQPVSKPGISFLKIESDIYVLDQASTSAPVKCGWVQNNILIFLAVRRKCSIKYTSHLQYSWLHYNFRWKRVNNLVKIAYLKIITITIVMI